MTGTSVRDVRMGFGVLPGRTWPAPIDPCGPFERRPPDGGGRSDRAINLGAFNAPTPPKGRNSDLPRKEVIQPHLPVRLPCYDFVPITSLTLGRRLPCGRSRIRGANGDGHTKTARGPASEPSVEQRLGVSVVPGSTRSLQLSERCCLAQDLILRCEVPRRWWRRGDSNS